ncbi:MAG: stage V sporulation protein AC, partial [Oscillospiraceae bacterium]
MKITPTQYSELAKQASPKTKSYKTIPSAFAIGGLICVIGQLLLYFYEKQGLTVEVASTLVSVTLVLLAAILTGLNVYDNIAKLGGAGTLVPITGFSNAVCSPALEFKSEGFILGLGAKMFIIAGPVIVYGVLTSIGYGLIIYVM